MMRTRLSFAAVALSLLSTGAAATSICRWVNESGRTQIAEVVPEKFRAVAICTDSQKYELSPEKRQAAEQRVAEDQARARQSAAKPPGDRASSPARPTLAASGRGRLHSPGPRLSARQLQPELGNRVDGVLEGRRNHLAVASPMCPPQDRARIRLFFGRCSSSHKPNASSRGGT